MMHGRGKSDEAIIAAKPANKAERSAAELVERRAEAKGNEGQQSTRRTQSRISVSQLLARIRHIVAVDTRGGSRMRESCTYGSVRGARGNSRPYRDAPMPNGCVSERCRDTRKEMNERCLDATPFTDGVPACCFNATLSKPIQFLSSFP